MAATEDELSFEIDVKPLFTQRDQEAMLVSFDLWDYEDVREYADRILQTLEEGRMPCYGAWPEDQIALFRRWMNSGMAE